MRSARNSLGVPLLFLLIAINASRADEPAAKANAQADLENVAQGSLRIVDKEGTVVDCPLKHTAVSADISGFIARVGVTQTFVNPTQERIEAVYVFPLPHEAAVDAMTMAVGDRKIVGVIKRRQEARQVYQQALAAGQTAALLEQERPNIFTQSVGNIEPGQEVKIEISYVDVLRYDMGTYEFQFPMVVGPRYIPGNSTSTPQSTPQELRGKVSTPVANTDRVPDAERISPPVLKPGTRNGHDIALTLTLDAGVPIENLDVGNHRAEVTRDGDRKAKIVLAANDSIPNKDFVVRYDVVGKKPAMAMLAHTGSHSADAKTLGDGYFLLMIQPQDDERLRKSPPRDIVFLVDVSGSMSGQPTAKVVETMQHMLKLCRAEDTVQVVTFANQATKLFEKPVPVTPENIQQALNFSSGLKGSGGTEMLKGVRLAMDEPIEPKRLRVIVMLTDGYIGNEAEIIEHVGRRCGDQIRFWCVGIGQSPNMFLVDGVAKQGGGMGKQLGLNDDSQALSQEIMTRIQRAQLSKVKIDWGTYRVSQTYPAKIPELWAGRPIVVFGRYAGGGQAGKITVSGDIEGEPASWPLEVNLPAKESGHDVLASVWARRKIEDLMQQAFYQDSPAIEEEVTAIALDYRLMSQYTSFVAVDAKDAQIATPRANPPRRMLVPVPLPEGTRWEGFFGEGWDTPVLGDFDALSMNLSTSRVLGKQLTDSYEAFRGRRPTPSRGPGRPEKRESLVRSRQLSITNPAPQASAASGYGLGMAGMRSQSVPASGGLAGGGGFGGAASFGTRVKGTEVAEAAKALPELRLQLESRTVEERLSKLTHFYEAVPTATNEQSNKSLEAARNAFKSGIEHQKNKEFDQARMALTQACLHALAVSNAGLHNEGISDAAMTALEEVRDAQHAEWTRNLPALGKRLDVVVREKSVAEAVALLAKASRVAIELSPGSLNDSEALLGTIEKVNYLDLRHATLAESLDWLLIPARLTWRVTKDGKRIVVATDRRLEGESSWVYDVMPIASPLAKETDKKADDQKRLDDALAAANELLDVFREQAPESQGGYVAWFAPGQILVTGTPQQHEAIAKLIADLADPKARFKGAAAKLHAKTVARAATNRKLLDAERESSRAYDVAATHYHFGWRLLSEAAAGRVDEEALTELRVAWSNAETTKMLADDRAALALRSAWIVNESARFVADHRELAELAAIVREKSKAAASAAIAAVQAKENEKQPSPMLAALYGTLAHRDDAARFEELASLLRNRITEKPDPATSFVLALLTPKADDSQATLVRFANDGVYGEDSIVLLAWACRQAGEETWSTFRSQQSDRLGEQPLSGDVVVFIHRLSGTSIGRLARR